MAGPPSVLNLSFLHVTASICLVCGKEFFDKAALRDHLVSELEVPPELVPFVEIELGVDPGEQSPSTASTDFGEDPVQCWKCDRVCKSARGLSQHMGKAHCSKKRHSVCKLCGNAFRNKYALRFHVKQVHDQTTRVACQVCGAVLYNKYVLLKHTLKAHPSSCN